MTSYWPTLAALPRDTVSALTFLSRLPVPAAGHERPDFTRVPAAFPLAGLLIGLGPAAVCLASVGIGLSPLVAAILAVAALAIITGALHEDGLADCADGFFGAASPERKRAIMRDPTVGVFGVLALIFSVGLRIALLAALLGTGWVAGVTALICGSILSRASMVGVWHVLPAAPAIEDGRKGESLARRFGEPSRVAVLVAAALSVIATALLVLLFGAPLIACLLMPVAAGLAGLPVGWLAQRHIGGHTGDVLGATQQVSEVGVYLALAITMSAP